MWWTLGTILYMSMTNIQTLTVLLVQTVRHSHWSYVTKTTPSYKCTCSNTYCRVEWLHFWQSFDSSSCGKAMCVNIAGWCTFKLTGVRSEGMHVIHTFLNSMCAIIKGGRAKFMWLKKSCWNINLLFHYECEREKQRVFSLHFIQIYSICEFHFNKSTLFPFL